MDFINIECLFFFFLRLIHLLLLCDLDCHSPVFLFPELQWSTTTSIVPSYGPPRVIDSAYLRSSYTPDPVEISYNGHWLAGMRLVFCVAGP